MLIEDFINAIDLNIVIGSCAECGCMCDARKRSLTQEGSDKISCTCKTHFDIRISKTQTAEENKKTIKRQNNERKKNAMASFEKRLICINYLTRIARK